MIDRKTFFATIRGALFDGSLSQRQVDGMNALLDAWQEGYSTADDRWLAYCLATTYHETGRAMYPVPEGGKGKGHPYGVPGADGQIAYGRGFVQLTWASNYARADDELHLNGALVKNYDLALSPDIAAEILFRGMVEAWFTKFKLSDYLNATTADYLHARRIVNGMDKADLIAGYAVQFYAAITAAKRKGADTTPVVPVPAAPVTPPRPTDTTAFPPSLVVKPPAPAPASDPVSDFIHAITKPLEDAITPTPSGPSPAPVDVPPATATESSIMNPFTTIIGLIQTAMAGASVVAQYGSAIPSIVQGVENIVPAAEQLFTDLKEIKNDLEAGKYNEVGDDLQKVMADIGAVIDKAGLTFGALAGAVNKTPTLPTVAGAKAVTAATS